MVQYTVCLVFEIIIDILFGVLKINSRDLHK